MRFDETNAPVFDRRQFLTRSGALSTDTSVKWAAVPGAAPGEPRVIAVGEVLVEVHAEGGSRLRARLPAVAVTRFGEFVVNPRA